MPRYLPYRFGLIPLFVLVVVFSLLFAMRADAASPQTEALINQARAQYGLAPLRVDYRLENAADFHDRWMADHAVFCHVCPGEPEPAQRLYNAGYIHNGFGEIVGAGYQTPQDVVAGWLASPGHKAIMLGPYRDIGCDMLYQPGTQWTWYWTCDFGNTDEPIGAATPRSSATFPIPQATETRIFQPTIPTPRPFDTRTPTPRPYVPPTPTRYAPPAQPTATPLPPPSGGSSRVAYVAVTADSRALNLVGQLCASGGGADCDWQPPNIIVRLRDDAQAYQVANFNRLCGSSFQGVSCQ